MKHIKKYNESKKEGKPNLIYVVLKSYNGLVNESFAFVNHMKAADKFIKLINDIHDTEFEPYYEDGERLFVDVDENPDFEKAIEYVAENEISIEILDIEITY